MIQGLRETDIVKFSRESAERISDRIVIEEPLEVRFFINGKWQPVYVTMRTPGMDNSLALGFIFNEGIINHIDEVREIIQNPSGTKRSERGNVVGIIFNEGCEPDEARWKRNFYATSSCGVCGKTSIEAIACAISKRKTEIKWDAGLLMQLPEELRKEQRLFKQTGGLHATGLYNENGKLICAAEDIGRHNALDKVTGEFLQSHNVSPFTLMTVISGRPGFEMVQKCLRAGFAGLVAVGAPSSLAVELAVENGFLLAGFVKGDGMNVYSGTENLSI